MANDRRRGFHPALALFLLFSLAGCGGEEAPSEEAAPPRSEARPRPAREKRPKPTPRATEPAPSASEAPAGASAKGVPPPGPSLPELVDPEPWFTEVTDEMGLDVVHVAGTTEGFHLPQIIGSGAALIDREGDGDLDLYLIHGGPDPARPREREGVKNRLLENVEGRRFRDVTEGAGLDGGAYGQGAAVADVDNDGDEDLFLANWGPDQLFVNDGEGAFRDVSVPAGLRPAAGEDGGGSMSASAAFLDYDRDGFLDLYVTQYVDYLPGKRCFDFADRHDYCGPSAFDPLPDRLLHNTGEGTFVDVSSSSGIRSRAAAGLGVVCIDLDDDGWLDVFVANDGYENHLWTNRHDGTFVEDAVILGIAFNQSGQAEAGMGVLAEDFDGDGRLDFFLTHLTNETNTLYRGLGGGMGFTDSTGRSGLAASSVALTGFGTGAFDAELDGDLDLLVVDGRVKRGPVYAGAALGDPWNDYAEPNLFYLNDGKGAFESGRRFAAAFTDRLEVSRGLTIGDLDGDADPDFVVTGLDERARVYRNDAPRVGAGLLVEAWEPELHRHADGATLILEVGGRRQLRTLSRSQGYLTSNDPRVHFGTGTADEEVLAAATLTVRWVDGTRERFAVPGWNRTIRLVHGEGEDLP